MRNTILFLLILLFCSAQAVQAKGKDEVRFFARYECSKENVLVGDSVVVNVVLYASQPFQQADCKTKTPKIKGGHSRLLPSRGERQQQRVRLEDGIYYGIIWERYMVGSDEVESIRFPELQFEGTFIIYEDEYDYEPLDPFGFFSRPTRKSHTTEASCKSSTYTLPVVARPKRSTQEVISSGGQVA